MKSHPWSRTALLAIAAFALAGCGKTSSLQSPAAGGGVTPTASDQAQIAQALQEASVFVQEDLTTSSLPFEADARGTFAVVRPWRFWREITDVQTTMETVLSNPDSLGRPLLATVTIHRALTGTFNLVGRVFSDTDTTVARVRKPLADDWTRVIALSRRPTRSDTGLTRWRLAGTSGVDVRTKGGATRILSLHVQAPGLDTTITDPLKLHRLHRIFRVSYGDTVTVTATTQASDDVVLFHGQDLRRRFVNNGDGTHTFKFRSGMFRGLRHFAVDALSHGTLFDDAAPYDANIWAMIFSIERVRMPDDDNDGGGDDDVRH
jgi:hypothetical protein